MMRSKTTAGKTKSRAGFYGRTIHWIFTKRSNWKTALTAEELACWKKRVDGAGM